MFPSTFSYTDFLYIFLLDFQLISTPNQPKLLIRSAWNKYASLVPSEMKLNSVHKVNGTHIPRVHHSCKGMTLVAKKQYLGGSTIF